MNQKVLLIGFTLMIAIVFSNWTQQSDFPVLKGPYLGQTPPGIKPALFKPAVFPEGKGVLNAVFSPDGNTFFFTFELIPGRSYQTYMMGKKDGIWSKPEVEPLLENLKGGEPSISSDGAYLFFNSRKDKNGGAQGNADIWRLRINNGKYGIPEKIGLSINSKFNEGYPVLSKDNVLYFHSNREAGEGSFDLYSSRFVDGKFIEPENLGDKINSKFPEFHPGISPDGSYLVFSSPGRPDGFGQIDLYVSFKGKDGKWTKAVNLGREINSKVADYMPFVSHDGNYLFFTSTRKIEGVDSGTSPFGKPSIYWVSAEVIEKLRPVIEIQPVDDSYLNQDPPGITPKVFAPGVISSGGFDYHILIRPNSNEVYYETWYKSIQASNSFVIKWVDGKWGKAVPFLPPGRFNKELGGFSKDGKVLFFSTNKPGGGYEYDIHYLNWENNKWGSPIKLGTQVNTKNREQSPSVSSNGNLYFYSKLGRSTGIFVSMFKDGKYDKAVPLSDAINNEEAHNPVIAPDESYLIFTSYRPGGMGDADLYISFRNRDGSWTRSSNLGHPVNTKFQDDYASVSPDGKYLFFASDRDSKGSTDIWWVSTKLIEKIKKSFNIK